MTDLIAALLDHQGAADDQTALAAVVALGEVATSGDAAEVADDLKQLVARLVDPSLTSCLLDWWCRVALGEVANGHCYQLPDQVPPELRLALEQLRDVHGETTAVRWLAARQRLDAAREAWQAGTHTPLDLDWHGNSKLPDEREMWVALRDAVSEQTTQLADGRPGPDVGVDESDVRRMLARTTIVENSRRWSEMQRRAQVLVDYVYDRQDDARISASAGQVPAVQLLDEVPTPVAEEIGGREAEFILGPVLRDGAEPASAVVLAERLNGLLEGLDADARGKMAVRLQGWLAAANRDLRQGSPSGRAVQLPAIATELDVLSRLQSALDDLVRADVDTDEIELEMLDGRLREAMGLVDALQASEELTLTASKSRQDVGTALDRFRRADAEPDADLIALARDLDDQPDAATLDAVPARIGEATARLDAILRERREAEFQSIVAALTTLGARPELRFDVEREGRAGTPSQARLDELEETLAELRTRRARQRTDRQTQLDEDLATPGLLRDEAAADIRARALTLRALGAGDADVMTALERLGELGEDVRRQRVRRWRVGDSETSLIEHIVEYCTDRIDYDEHDLRRLYVALKTKPFVILAGLTGSGKSSIVRLFAESVGATAGSGQFHRIAVRPDWIDQSEVLGYINPTSNRFEPGWMADVIRSCQKQPDQLFFVLLDEMNLAPVEQYLAEFLSAMEEARAGFADVAIPLYTAGAEPENRDEWPPSLVFPTNLMLVGTVNVDESTRALSDRVIDRASVLQLGVRWSRRHHEPQRARTTVPMTVDVAAWNSVVEAAPDDRCHDLLVELAEALGAVGVGVGLRAHIEVERFLSNADDVIADDRAVDTAVLQRFLPKVRGFKRDLTPALERVRIALEAHGCRASTALIDHWLDPQTSEDTFLDGLAPHPPSAHPYG